MVDIARPSQARKKKIRRILYGGSALLVIALISVGVNSVVRLNNSALHAEMLAIMMAQHRLGSYTLAASSSASYDLVSSCDPCAMCLGAVLHSVSSHIKHIKKRHLTERRFSMRCHC